MGDRNDDFYVGYIPRMPPSLARFLAPRVALLVLVVVGLVVGLLLLHNPYDEARSDGRDIRDFEGILLAEPVPHLIVPRPSAEGDAAFSRYLLVARGKSAPSEKIMKHAGRWCIGMAKR